MHDLTWEDPQQPGACLPPVPPPTQCLHPPSACLPPVCCDRSMRVLTDAAGVTLGHKHVPIDRVGLYIPGGRYPIMAAACMQSVTAKAAGCRSIVACTPTRADVPLNEHGERQPHPYVIAALHLGGVEEIYCVGGIQAVGMMAHGTETVAPVDFLCGPGNQFVAEAKLQLFGKVIAAPCAIICMTGLGCCRSELIFSLDLQRRWSCVTTLLMSRSWHVTC